MRFAKPETLRTLVGSVLKNEPLAKAEIVDEHADARQCTGVGSLEVCEKGDVVLLLGAAKPVADDLKSVGGFITTFDVGGETIRCLHDNKVPYTKSGQAKWLWASLMQFCPDAVPTRKLHVHPGVYQDIDPPIVQLPERIHVGPGTFIGKAVDLGQDTQIGANVIIGERTKIGNNCMLHSSAYIGPRTVIGDNVIVWPGAVIGADGFGYEQVETGEQREAEIVHWKVYHGGNVLIEDNVEIGANTCVDRGTVGSTRIGAGTKIDNLVQVAHNVVIGRNCVIMGHCAIGGSAVLGDHVVLYGKVGVKDNVVIGSNTVVLGRSVVIGGLEGGDAPKSPRRYAGMPARKTGIKEYNWLTANIVRRIVDRRLKEVLG